MNVAFGLLDRSGGRVEEDALHTDHALASALLKDLARSEGSLRIEDPDSGARASVGDTLPVLIDRFCLSGLQSLRDDGRLDIDFLDREETLEIAVAGDEVQYESSRFGKRAFPKDAYFGAMQACGERYTALLQAVPHDETDELEGSEAASEW